MKIIEAMKKIKALQVKADDLREKIAKHSADMDFETPLYPDQKSVVDGWLQAHEDILKEILALRIAIQATNLDTEVTIELGEKKVTKSIAEWIHRRRDLAGSELKAWSAISDRGLKEGTVIQSTGEKREVRIRRYYDPAKRDARVGLYRGEPFAIDAALEVVNAVTEVVAA